MRIKPKKFDIGEVLATRRVAISEEVLMSDLHDELAAVGAELLVDSIKDLRQHQPIEQDNTKASYGKHLSY